MAMLYNFQSSSLTYGEQGIRPVYHANVNRYANRYANPYTTALNLCVRRLVP